MKGGEGMETIISWVVSFTVTITSGIVLFLIQRFLKNHRKKEEEHDKAKQKDNILILRSLNALGKLTVANSIALRDGRTNGEMSSALKEYETIEKEMYEHLISCHAEKDT